MEIIPEFLDPAITRYFTRLFGETADKGWGRLKGKSKEHDIFGQAAGKYLEKLAKRYNHIKVLGMSEPVPLHSLYVRVNILEKITERRRLGLEDLENYFDRDLRSYGKVETTKSGIAALNSYDKFIVLGKPGAGKTTYLKYLALQSINEKVSIKNRKIPVFISLKELADKKCDLFTFIGHQFNICALPDTTPFIARLLEQGKCLILLDGLDEVQEERKDALIQDLLDFSDKYADNQFIISCRVAAYNRDFTQFTDVEMADFNDGQIQRFIKNWFRDEEIAKACWEKLKNEPPLKELASTPILLTLLCIVYDDSMDFPPNRAELYEEAIDTLLKKWDSTRRIKRYEPYKKMSVGSKRTLFRRIAAQTFEQGRYFMKKKTLVGFIADYIKNFPDIQEADLEDTACNILEAIEINHGIFVKRARGIYSFSHLTFQEYFMARFLVSDKGQYARTDILPHHYHKKEWREVILLMANMEEDAGHFLKKMSDYADGIIRQNQGLKKLLLACFTIEEDWFPEFENKIFREKFYVFFRNRVVYHFLDRARALDLARALALDLARALDLDLARALDLALDLDLALALEKNDFDQLATYLTIKTRVVECLNADCYLEKEMRESLWSQVLQVVK